MLFFVFLGIIVSIVITVTPIVLLQKWAEEDEKSGPKLTDCSQTLCRQQVEQLQGVLTSQLKNLTFEEVAYKKAGVFLDGTSDRIDIDVTNDTALTDNDINKIYELAWRSEIYPLFSVSIQSKEFQGGEATGSMEYDSTILDDYKEDSDFRSKYGERKPGQLVSNSADSR